MNDNDDSNNKDVEITLVISRGAYERAKLLAEEQDPRKSLVGEFAGMFDVEEFLAHFLEAHLE